MEAKVSLARGILLIQRHHFKEAEQEIRKVLAQAPENARAHAILGLALSAQNKSREGIAEARQAVGLAPNMAYAHFVLAMTLFLADQHQAALGSINEALRIDPEEADYFELQGKIYAALEKWEPALEAARKGLAADPQHVDCANLEAMALVYLGRPGEANLVIESALQRDPENATTHANLGWANLHAGKHQDALTHFREALRLNPNLEWARKGIIEAMKARSILYRPILAYFLWMNRLPSQMRWAFIVGLWAVIRVFRRLAMARPEWNPILLPLIGLYLMFALMSWIATPLFNLFLRLDKFGRLALTEEEINASNWLGLCFFGGLALLLAGIPTKLPPLSLAGIGLFAMSIPVSGIFHGQSRKSRILLTIYAVVLALIGILATGVGLLNPDAGLVLGVFFALGWILYTWVANALMRIQ